MITTEVHTDDYVAEAKFDAEPWFQQATDKQILALAGCQFGGDYPADEVAQWFDGKHEEVSDVFRYLGHKRNCKRLNEFLCVIK
jgi:hypothetical protein